MVLQVSECLLLNMRLAITRSHSCFGQAGAVLKILADPAKRASKKGAQEKLLQKLAANSQTLFFVKCHSPLLLSPLLWN